MRQQRTRRGSSAETAGRETVILGIVAYNVASFAFEYDFFDALEIFGPEAAALKRITEKLKECPQEIVAFLETFGTQEAESIIRSIEALKGERND